VCVRACVRACTFGGVRAQVEAAAGVRMRGHEEEVVVDHKGRDVGSQLAITDQSKHYQHSTYRIDYSHLNCSAVDS